MNLSVFRTPRLRLATALMVVAALSWVAAAVVIVNNAAIPHARLIEGVSIGCTLVLLTASVFVGLSRFLQNVKR